MPELPRDPVPPKFFGKDHWSTFAYLETRCVDHGGRPDNRHMRCDPKRHPGLAHAISGASGKKYPTRLFDMVELHDHDDWDCVDDLVAAGLLELNGTGIFPVVALTDFGHEVAGKLRQHKAKGGNFAEFCWEKR